MRRSWVGWMLLGSGCLDKNPDFIGTMTTDGGTGGTAVGAQTDSDPSSVVTTDSPPTTDPSGTTGVSEPATSTPTTDGSTGMVASACGDGKLDAGEECDDGDGDDQNICRNDCTLAECGDGFVSSKLEECDDGNDQDDDACLTSCKAAACGDGVVQAGVEECDDGDMLGDDGCEPDCRPTRKLVFVTSKLFNGAIGGLLGADTACEMLAQDAGLPGSKDYHAWLSTFEESPLTRMKHSPFPYVRVDGVLVAQDWDGLVSGMLAAPIDRTEKNGLPPLSQLGGCEVGGVLTNTTFTGTMQMQTSDCSGWTDLEGVTGWGIWKETNAKWTDGCVSLCSVKAPIYCVQE